MWILLWASYWPLFFHHLFKEWLFPFLNKFMFAWELCLGGHVFQHILVLFIPDCEFCLWHCGIRQLDRHFTLDHHVELISDVLIVKQNIAFLELLLDQSFLEVVSVTLFEYSSKDWNRFIYVLNALLVIVLDWESVTDQILKLLFPINRYIFWLLFRADLQCLASIDAFALIRFFKWTVDGLLSSSLIITIDWIS